MREVGGGGNREETSREAWHVIVSLEGLGCRRMWSGCLPCLPGARLERLGCKGRGKIGRLRKGIGGRTHWLIVVTSIRGNIVLRLLEDVTR
jgi:protein gp37